MTERITNTAQLLKTIEFILWTGPINEYGIPVYQDIYDEIEDYLRRTDGTAHP